MKRGAALMAIAMLLCAGAEARTELDFDTLMAGSYPRLVDFSAYAPGADATAPTNHFEGRLQLGFAGTLPHHTLIADPAYVSTSDVALAVTWPDDFSYEFVQQGGVLVPLQRGTIPGSHDWWELILEPGKVWNEPGDRGYTRVALPFSLQEKNANCTHNGVLMFVFRDDGAISQTAMQIASETCQYLQLDLWALLRTRYDPRLLAGSAGALAAHAATMGARMPNRSLAQLRVLHPQIDTERLRIGAAAGRTLFGLVLEGVNYLSECATRSGDYPYCDVLDLPSYSLAKSVFAGFALMDLQARHPAALSQQISEHVPECRSQNWNGVSFAHALDMATGNFDSTDFEADESAAATAGLFVPLSHHDKIRYSCTAYPHRARAGTRWVYHSSDTYVLGTALNHYLRSLPGHAADDIYSDLVYADIYAPLHLSETTRVTRRTYDAQAQPFTGWGLTFQPSDIARLGTFLSRDRGKLGGRQVLDARMLRAALGPERLVAGLQTGDYSNLRYKYGFWARNVKAALGCTNDTWVPFMSGFGGISVVLFPSGIVYYNFADDAQAASFDWTGPATEARKLADYCAH